MLVRLYFMDFDSLQKLKICGKRRQLKNNKEWTENHRNYTNNVKMNVKNYEEDISEEKQMKSVA